MIESAGPASRVRKFGLLALLILAIILMLAALLGLVFPYSLALAIPAIACAIWAWKRTSQAKRAIRLSALTVGVISGFLLVAGGFWSFVRYQAEAPPGYLRVNFDETFLDGGMDEIPDHIRPLIDQKICVKGYAFPGTKRVMSDFFMQQSQPLLWGRIQVILQDGHPWKWTPQTVAVSGRLILNPEYRSFLTDDRRLVCKYLLIDAVVRPATTPFGLSKRPRSSC